MLSSLFSIIFPVFGVIGVGITARHFKVWNKAAVIGVNHYAYYIGLPALIFKSIISLTSIDFFTRDTLFMIGGVVAVHVAVCLLILGFTRLFRMPRQISAIAPLLATFGSTAYLGIPFLTYLLGPQGTAYASFISTILIVVLICTHKIILNKYDEIPATKNTFLSLIELPFIWAVLFGTLWISFKIPPLPAGLAGFIDILAAGAVPTALLALGAFVYDTKIDKLPWLRVSVYSVIKTAVIPFFVFLLLSFFGIHGIELIVAVCLSAVSTGITSFTLAEEHHVGMHETAGTIMLSMIFSLLSLSLISYLLYWCRTCNPLTL